MSIHNALEVSRNVPAIKLGRAVGLNKVIETTTAPLESVVPMEPVTSLPLVRWCDSVQMAGAYATFTQIMAGSLIRP